MGYELVKERHRLRFDRWSKDYDRSILQQFLFDKTHDMFTKEVLPFLTNGLRILDVGCGTGKFAFKLFKSTRGFKIDIHGIDLSGEMIERAKSKLQDEPIEFKVGDVERIPYDEDTFDVITCSHSFHHYPDQKKAVSEMYRVLKNGGRLMMIDGCRDRLLGRLIFGIVQIIEKDVYHIFEKELKELLLSVGFRKVVQKKFNPIPPLLFTSGYATKRGFK